MRPCHWRMGLALSCGLLCRGALAQPAAPPAPSAESPPSINNGQTSQTPPTLQQGQPAAARNPTPPATPWKPLFFDNDFSAYVGKEPYVLGEELKQMPLDLPGDFDFTFSVGGQVRHRYMYEDDRIRPGGSTHNDYQLWRWRQYYDLKNEYVRLYVETIEADSFGEELQPLAIDVNRFDLLNAFIDLNVYDVDDVGKGTFRYGRQELLYGKQRLLSPLDWSNTRRNFEGYKFFHTGEGWRFDAFAVNPARYGHHPTRTCRPDTGASFPPGRGS